MKLNRLSLIVAGALALGGMQSAMACSFAAWGQGSPPGGTGVVGSPINGEPDDAIPVKRYSGRCGLSASAAASYVQDGLPTAEPTYNAQFYVLPGGIGTYFTAEDSGAVAQITVGFDGTNITLAAGTGTATVPATLNRWYRVLVQWSATATNMQYSVKGAGSPTAATGTLAGVAAAARIETAKLGLIGAGTGPMTADAFESRRTSAPTLLCRGDANGDTNRNSGDLIGVRNEFLSIGLASGQPDCNEDSNVNSGDLICVRNIFLAAQGACTNEL